MEEQSLTNRLLVVVCVCICPSVCWSSPSVHSHGAHCLFMCMCVKERDGIFVYCEPVLHKSHLLLCS